MRLKHQNSTWGSNYALARFDFSSLPQNITVSSARMRFYVGLNNWPGATDFAPVAIFNNTQEWAESTVTFDSAPTHHAAAAETLDHFGLVGVDDIPFTGANTITAGGWLEYTGAGMMALVQGWADGSVSNCGVSIKGTGAFLDSDRLFELQCKENGFAGVRPQLLIGYTEAIDYTDWACGWEGCIGTETNDFDGDGLSNVYEFGLGGDPTNAFDRGTSPVFEVMDVGGSNVARYVYPKLSYPGSGLAYFLELSTNLADGIWTNAGYTVAGIDVPGGPLNLVTNVADTVADQKFIRLIIESQPEPFNVKNFGALGDGSADDTAAILAAIDAADAAAFFADVVFPSGSYRIGSTNEHALQLENLSHVRLKGCGTNSVLLVSNPENGGISFTDSTNVAVQGLAIDYDPLPFTQGTITAVDASSGTIDLQIDPGYLELSHPAFTNAESRWGITVDLAREAYGLWAYFPTNWIPLGNRTWRMALKDPGDNFASLLVGDRYVHMARRWTAFDIEAESCVGVEVKDVTVHAAAGLTTGFFYSSGVVVDGLQVGLKPGSNRLLSTNGDAVHSAGCSDGLLIENCNFEGMPDDGINIHGRGGPIISNVTDTVKWVGMQRPAFYAAGDEIQILNNAAGGIRGNAILLDAVRLNDFVWEITLDSPMPDVFADPAWVNGDKLNHISRCGQGSIIRNNFIGAHRGREVLIQSHDVTISNNVFYNPSLAWDSVSLHNDYTYYSEGPAAYNVGIYGNTFKGGTNQWTWSSPSIGIHSTLAGGIQSPTYDSTNIVISGNAFINIDGPAVGVSSARDVRIIDNTVDTDFGIKIPSSAVILLEHARDIQIDNLEITDLNPATYAGVHIKDTVPLMLGAVVITDLTTDLAAGSVDVRDDR